MQLCSKIAFRFTEVQGFWESEWRCKWSRILHPLKLINFCLQHGIGKVQ